MPPSSIIRNLPNNLSVGEAFRVNGSIPSHDTMALRTREMDGVEEGAQLAASLRCGWQVLKTRVMPYSFFECYGIDVHARADIAEHIDQVWRTGLSPLTKTEQAYYWKLRKGERDEACRCPDFKTMRREQNMLQDIWLRDLQRVVRNVVRCCN